VANYQMKNQKQCIAWFKLRYGRAPTKEELRYFQPLWLWAKKQKPKNFKGIKSQVTNRYIIRQRALEQINRTLDD
jgi:hypothetical protein